MHVFNNNVVIFTYGIKNTWKTKTKERASVEDTYDASFNIYEKTREFPSSQYTYNCGLGQCFNMVSSSLLAWALL